MFVKKYRDKVEKILHYVMITQLDAVEDAVQRISASIDNGGILHVFGSGHSVLVAREIVGRAGGLVPINLISDPTEGFAERCEGYAPLLLDDYAHRYGLHPGEGMLIISNSGINPSPVEMALEARKRGLFTVGLTSLEHSKSIDSRHSSGKKLYELVHVVLDNGGIYGDASVEVPGLKQKVGPLSTIAGAFILNILVGRVIEKMLEDGRTPPVLLSLNIEGSDVANEEVLAPYRGRLSW